MICYEADLGLYGYFRIFLIDSDHAECRYSLRGGCVLMLQSRRSFLGPQRDVSVLQLLQGAKTPSALSEEKGTGQENAALTFEGNAVSV